MRVLIQDTVMRGSKLDPQNLVNFGLKKLFLVLVQFQTVIFKPCLF
jgi:hypothetical protein